MTKVIIGFIGKLSAGKGTACAYLKEKYQAQTVMFSQSLRDILNRLYLPETRENMQLLSQVLRENFGQEVLAKVVAEDASQATSKIVAVDGVRRPKDIEFLRQLDNFFLLYIEAEQRLRYERMLKRGQNPGEGAGDLSFEQFRQNEAAEAESLIDEVKKEAKFTIANNGTLDQFYQQIEDVLSRIR